MLFLTNQSLAVVFRTACGLAAVNAFIAGTVLGLLIFTDHSPLVCAAFFLTAAFWAATFLAIAMRTRRTIGYIPLRPRGSNVVPDQYGDLRTEPCDTLGYREESLSLTGLVLRDDGTCCREA